MELSAEDTLRINVLLAGSVKAVRIDESSMTLYALSDKGEARVKLNPNCRDETYLRRVREALSSHVLGSPGGYPVYLKRWTRMGQTRDGILESLLLLGEPEAVIAVVNAAGITNEIARRAWWASQTAENARCMLAQQSVVQGDMGPVLADFLIEFLPFETEARDMIASVRLILQSGLISNEDRLELWGRGKHKNAYYVGFLQAVPDELPVSVRPHPLRDEVCEKLEGLRRTGNPFAVQLCRLLGSEGQGFLAVLESVLDKPSNQDVVVSLLHALAAYFRPIRRTNDTGYQTMDAIQAAADDQMTRGAGHGHALGELLAKVPGMEKEVHAMLVLSMVDEPLVNPIFSRTDAIGTVMRRKLKPVSEPLQRYIESLRNRDGV
jgi:hypothetical protein